jgi:hypothetical protein
MLEGARAGSFHKIITRTTKSPPGYRAGFLVGESWVNSCHDYSVFSRALLVRHPCPVCQGLLFILLRSPVGFHAVYFVENGSQPAVEPQPRLRCWSGLLRHAFLRNFSIYIA